jgi:uncharacterized coiled-coil DUF342 family protein
MLFFGKKKIEEEKIPEEVKLPTLETIMQEKPVEEIRLPTIETIMKEEPVQEFKQEPKQPRQETQSFKEEVQEPKQEATVPLFVKLEKYNEILDSINELKSCVDIIKNSFVVIDRLDEMKRESLESLQEAIKNFEKRLSLLDSELMRPPEYSEEVKTESYEAEDLKGVLSDLKGQVEQLKTELKQMA